MISVSIVDSKHYLVYGGPTPRDADTTKTRGVPTKKGPFMAGKQVETRPEFTFEAIRTRFNNEADGTDVEGGSLQKFIRDKLSAIMSAGDFAAINEAAVGTGLTASKECVGRRFEIKDLAIRESGDTFRGNNELDKYVLLEVVDCATGEELIVDGGGDTFVTQVMAMRDRYDFPFIGTVLARQTATGNNLLYWRFEDPKRKPVF